MVEQTESTPPDEKTEYGKIPGFTRAKNSLDTEQIGQLVRDVGDYEGEWYDSAHEIARAFHEDNPFCYNTNQCDIRDTAKEKVTKYSQPDWAWEMLSIYSEDLGLDLLEVPSKGSHKGLLISEETDDGEVLCFLYSKKANGISAINHIERYHLNILNVQSIGEELPSENIERVSLDIDESVPYSELRGIPMLKMNFNQKMVENNRFEQYFKGKVRVPGDWERAINKKIEEEVVKSSYPDKWFERWFEIDYEHNLEDIKEIYSLGDLIEDGHFFCGGVNEFGVGTGNIAVEFPEEWWEDDYYDDPKKLFDDSKVIIVDSGEYSGEDMENPLFGLREEVEERMIKEDPILSEEEKKLFKSKPE